MSSVVPLSALQIGPRCPPNVPLPSDGGRRALSHRVYNISAEPDLRVVWKKAFRAYEGEAPLTLGSGAKLCRWLSPQQWPYCRSAKRELTSSTDTVASSLSSGSSEQQMDAVASAAVSAAAISSLSSSSSSSSSPRSRRQQNTLMLVSMPCAFTDGGSNHRGALYDATRVLSAQHRGATPRFPRGGAGTTVRRYSIAAVGLTPYGHLADAHFYASTAAWVLTLLHLLPDSVPVLVASSRRLDWLYGQLGVRASRLHTLPSGGAAYADRLLSLVTTPFGALEPLGATALRRVRARLVPPPGVPGHFPPAAEEERTLLVYLSRSSQHPRRSVRNQQALLRALRDALASCGKMGRLLPTILW